MNRQLQTRGFSDGLAEAAHIFVGGLLDIGGRLRSAGRGVIAMMERNRFLEELRSGVLVGDGAIASELRRRQAISGWNVEQLNVVAPENVSSLHAEYVAAGSRVIETNTHSVGRLWACRADSQPQVRDIIAAGVGLARGAARPDTYVSGSLGPLPGVGAGTESENDRIAGYRELVTSLLDEGVDLLSLKSFSDLHELSAVIHMIRSLSDIPVLAHMTFERSGLAADGSSAAEMAEACIRAGADVIGANCGYGAQSVVRAASVMSSFGVPISAYMNAGFPEWVDGDLLYDSSPGYIAEVALGLVAKGVHLIGGCCGASPEYIRAIAQALHDSPLVPHARRTWAVYPQAAHLPASSVSDGADASSRILVQLDPPDGPDQTPVIDAAIKLRDAGVTRLSISDNCLAEARADALTTAGIVAHSTGLDVTLHLTCRDRNRLAIQSTIIGAQAVGIRSLLCVTGVPISMCQEANTSGVFDLNSIGLVRLVSECNSGRHGPNRQTSLEIGVAVNPNVRNLEGQVDKLRRKVDAGASFALTQPMFSVDRAERFREALDRCGVRIPVFMGVMPLTSTRNAEFVHNEVPGIYVPEEVRQFLQRYERVSDQRAAMTELLLRCMDGVYPAFSSFFVIAPRNNVELVLPILSQAFALVGGGPT